MFLVSSHSNVEYYATLITFVARHGAGHFSRRARYDQFRRMKDSFTLIIHFHHKHQCWLTSRGNSSLTSSHQPLSSSLESIQVFFTATRAFSTLHCQCLVSCNFFNNWQGERGILKQ